MRDKSFTALHAEVQRLHRSWVHYKRLFEPSSTRAESAPALLDAWRTLDLLRWPLLRGVAIDICRLTDQSKQGSQQNLTLRRVLEEWEPVLAGNQDLAELLERSVREVHEIAAKPNGLRTLRNKALSHCDFDTAVGVVPSASVAIADLGRAVELIVRFRDLIAGARQGLPLDPQASGARQSSRDARDWSEEAQRLLATVLAGLRAAGQEPPAEWNAAE